MQTIDDPGDALAVLHDPGFVVPPVPAAAHGVAWLRASVGRFSDGAAHTRRRGLSESILSTVDPEALRAAAASSPHAHPVQLLCTALGLDSSPRTTDAVRVVAAAYQPGTGDEPAADTAVEILVAACGGTADETTAARIGLLVQACDATATLIARAAGLLAAAPAATGPGDPAAAQDVDRVTGAGELVAAEDVDRVTGAGELVAAEDVDRVTGAGELVAAQDVDRALRRVLRDAPPVAATKRMATRPADVGGAQVAPGEVVRVGLHGIPFGAGPRGCPGRAHALALAEGALSAHLGGGPARDGAAAGVSARGEFPGGGESARAPGTDPIPNDGTAEPARPGGGLGTAGAVPAGTIAAVASPVVGSPVVGSPVVGSPVVAGEAR
ncbi:hypothetical protein Daura_10570 [Dactylosporangium aurantiacum]|uniref:Cytochrome P450 n=1 Tax=Dactylosporangium aurantiacum TaxID=35754 RepID=A0A9Q9MJ51_9ACTN|nr:hypothetical protein [Dactylosporangium aurantiacum]MDG6109175.1 hypothetical protein [Dactylosporangium aurantiacum]UWZ56575.1 hypothetical protein Daura_10570 [Dactylosporangium aurantiacum]